MCFGEGIPKQTGFAPAMRKTKFKITEMKWNEKMKMLLPYTLLKTPQTDETQWNNTVSVKFCSI